MHQIKKVIYKNSKNNKNINYENYKNYLLSEKKKNIYIYKFKKSVIFKFIYYNYTDVSLPFLFWLYLGII